MNQNEVKQLYKLGEDVFKILTGYAAYENETFYRIRKRCPGKVATKIFRYISVPESAHF